jgi:Transposase
VERVRYVSDTELLPKSKPEVVQRLEVFTGSGRRRTWTAEQKARIVSESYESGDPVSRVAQRHALTAQQLFGWRARGAAGDGGSEREGLGLCAGDRGRGPAVRGGVDCNDGSR